MAYDLDSKPPSLLTVGNPKTAKGEKLGYLTAILHLAPHKLSGTMNVCSHASPGCIEACLNTAGRGGMGLDEDGLNMIQAARIRRTRFFKTDKAAFMEQLAAEIATHIKYAARHDLTPCVRLNGTSDLPWENISFRLNDYPWNNIMELHDDVQFYDYTKVPIRLRRNAVAQDNYHLSFSLSENNDNNAQEALAAGVNVVAVFSTRKKDELPTEYWGRPVIDGDNDDLRFLDPADVIVGLRAKGRGRKDQSGFVRHV